MPSVNAYLNFNGNTEGVFDFYRSVFGGNFSAKMRFSETPFAEQVAESDRQKIMHIALPIGSQSILMASDMVESMGGGYQNGNNFSIALQADSRPEADRLFAALSEGGKITMPLTDAFWGAYFGMLVDQFGIQWNINYQITPQQN